MSNYDDTQHERGGNPENTGEYSEKTYGTAEASVGAAIRRPKLGRGQIFDVVDEALREAYKEIPTDWVLAADTSRRSVLSRSFKEAASSIQACLARNNTSASDVSCSDNDVISDIERIARGSDPRGGNDLTQMALVSARLGRRIVERQTMRHDVHKLERSNSDLKAGDVLLGADGSRTPISGVQVEGEHVRVELPFGPVLLDPDGSVVIVVTEDLWENDPDAIV